MYIQFFRCLELWIPKSWPCIHRMHRYIQRKCTCNGQGMKKLKHTHQPSNWHPKTNTQTTDFQNHAITLSMWTVAVCLGMTSMLWDQMGQQAITIVWSGATITVPVRALLFRIAGVTSRVKTVEMISGTQLMFFFI